MKKNMKTRKGKDGFHYPYTSPDLVIDSSGKSATKKFEEISSQYKDIANEIGKNEDGSDIELPTTDKTIKGAITELFQNVSNGKQLIATAITDKGVTTSSDSTFQTMATNIRGIPNQGGGITPTGTINITANGTIDVTNYANAVINVE